MEDEKENQGVEGLIMHVGAGPARPVYSGETIESVAVSLRAIEALYGAADKAAAELAASAESSLALKMGESVKAVRVPYLDKGRMISVSKWAEDTGRDPEKCGLKEGQRLYVQEDATYLMVRMLTPKIILDQYNPSEEICDAVETLYDHVIRGLKEPAADMYESPRLHVHSEAGQVELYASYVICRRAAIPAQGANEAESST